MKAQKFNRSGVGHGKYESTNQQTIPHMVVRRIFPEKQNSVTSHWLPVLYSDKAVMAGAESHDDMVSYTIWEKVLAHSNLTDAHYV
jgi:hypothetical protein